MNKRKTFVVLLCLISPAITLASVNQITRLRVQKSYDHCRLLFDTTAPIRYHQFTLVHPDRVVVDINNARFVHVFERSLLTNTPIKDIRSGAHKNKILRVVFDLKHKVKVSSFTLKPSRQYPHYHLVLDLIWKKAKIIPRPFYKTAYNNTHYKVPVMKEPIPVQQAAVSKRSHNVVIVIDPGHGGKDPGATGPGGTHEKTIVLKISRDLQRDIDHQPGFVAYLTRKSDYYLTLRQRLAIARRYKADMFIAIHADAYRDSYAHGASIFALSRRGATSEAARWLAKRENESELMGGVNLSDKTNLLKSVLINLSQTATIRASLRIAQHIIHALGNFARLHHHFVEQASFVVLKSPDIPSLLVETGFISNPHEEAKLKNPVHQQRIASALMQGIRSYFVYSPPRGSWLATQKFNQRVYRKRYVVARGDTLTSIAEHFNVSLSQLRRLNRLRTGQLKSGQTLLIPRSSPKA